MKLCVVALMVSIVSTTVFAAPCSDGSGPQTAVANYLSAMQDQRFNDAYAYVTDQMTDGKPREEWAALQKLFYQGGGVNIFGIDIRSAQVVAGEGDCSGRANVPNVLKSRDKFNNQGTTEFEVYLVVKDDAGWRVDSQETLFEQSDVDVWFPGETMPEFRDQY